MNTAVMSWAWKQRLPLPDKRLLFALAEHADDQGLIQHLPITQLTARTGYRSSSIHQGLGRLIAARAIQWIDSDCYRLNLGSDSPSPRDGKPPAPSAAKGATSHKSMVVYLRRLFR